MKEKVTLLIEFILQQMKLSYKNNKNKPYIGCQNPVSYVSKNEDREYSATWYKTSGNLRVFNGDTINGKNFIPFKEVCSYLGFKYEYEKIMGEEIEDINVLYRKTNTIKKVVDSKSAPKEIEIDEKNYKECSDYLKNRKIKLVEGLIEPCVLEFEGKYGKFMVNYIAFRYPNGFAKYRVISNVNKKSRFLSFGGAGYRDFYKIRNNSSDSVLLIEGEIEGWTCSYYIDSDIYGLHNLNSLPETDSLKKYKQVICSIDYDKFDKVSWGLYERLVELCDKDAEIIIRPKLLIWKDEDFLDLDYNDLHKEGKLNKEIIETGLLSKHDIKKDVERFDFFRENVLTSN
jgi:hypothetical protein